MLDLILIVTVSAIKPWNLKTGSGKVPNEVYHADGNVRRNRRRRKRRRRRKEEEE